MAEAAPLESRCPRCGSAFHCGMNDSAVAGPCACTTLTLTPALRAELAARYKGCLCLACLRALAAGATAAATSG
ncbi:MAG: cysteine-rich CWC family protein [Piscinibacter sp.]|uniref:cysteine-rich CWC family protein n=1 Tax=Piscinibacter sp. TaxID=1903157 RepID=UPI003D0F024D